MGAGSVEDLGVDRAGRMVRQTWEEDFCLDKFGLYVIYGR